MGGERECSTGNPSTAYRGVSEESPGKSFRERVSRDTIGERMKEN
jgi:hypothetical protein